MSLSLVCRTLGNRLIKRSQTSSRLGLVRREHSKTPTEAEKGYEPGFFSRNPGIVFGGILISIIGYVYRGSKNKKNFEQIQTDIAEQAAISPYEAYELRSTNEIT